MRNIKILAALLFSLCLVPLTHAERVDIGNAELMRLATNGVLVVDIRTAREWEETGVMRGSKLITLFDENGHADKSAWLKKIREVAGPEQALIVVCRSGNRTKAASELLNENGYTKVYNLKDGIKGWLKEGRELTSPAL